jgi:hypothetical protein
MRIRRIVKFLCIRRKSEPDRNKLQVTRYKIQDTRLNYRKRCLGWRPARRVCFTMERCVWEEGLLLDSYYGILRI